VGRVWPRHEQRGRPLNAIVRLHVRSGVALYTFIANYGLGTYLDQREAATVVSAVQAYARDNDFVFLTTIGAKERESLKRSLSSCKVEPAGTLQNVWSCAVPVERDVFLLQVVLSASGQRAT
jgi:hypothetical protein